jgi:hypothetical protein
LPASPAADHSIFRSINLSGRIKVIRKKKIAGLLGLSLVVLIVLYLSQWTDLRERKFLVIVDMEPDAAAKSWDHHLMEKIPPLQAIIGDHAGRQFTPADPVVVVAISRAGLVTRKRPVNITIDLSDLDPARGYRVVVEDGPASGINLVEAIDPKVFRHQVLRDLQKIAGSSVLRD